jgi:hypothetical protein
MLEAHLVSENRLELMEKILGAFSESTSSKKYNNFALLLQKTHGICLKR